ncbi:MAG: hypothetical protein Q8K86_11600 [Candidatus Nanopelagicaceae bacterium]|nr:hypothetical protein [Candidatus Nanopelagicaceae bacterium]
MEILVYDKLFKKDPELTLGEDVLARLTARNKREAKRDLIKLGFSVGKWRKTNFVGLKTPNRKPVSYWTAKVTK